MRLAAAFANVYVICFAVASAPVHRFGIARSFNLFVFCFRGPADIIIYQAFQLNVSSQSSEHPPMLGQLLRLLNWPGMVYLAGGRHRGALRPAVCISRCVLFIAWLTEYNGVDMPRARTVAAISGVPSGHDFRGLSWMLPFGSRLHVVGRRYSALTQQLHYARPACCRAEP